MPDELALPQLLYVRVFPLHELLPVPCHRSSGKGHLCHLFSSRLAPQHLTLLSPGLSRVLFTHQSPGEQRTSCSLAQGPWVLCPRSGVCRAFILFSASEGPLLRAAGNGKGEAECVAGDMSLLAGLAWGLSANPHLAQSSWVDLVPTQGRISKNKEALVWSFVMK